jgi:hypothetical protein
MLRVFLGTVPVYLVAYALTPPDLGALPAGLVEPRPLGEAAFGLFVHAALFFGGWLQLYNLADRGFSLHVVVEAHRAPGAVVDLEALAAAYGGGRGLAAMVDKRIEGVLATGLARLEDGRLRPTARGRRAGRVFGALRRLLRLERAP